MSAKDRTNWFWSDWLGDQAVRRLSPAERGVWIDLLALAAAGSPTGYVCDDRGRPLTHEEIARVTGTTPVEVADLIAGILEKGAASRDRTGRLFNRRMVRDAELAAKRSFAGKKGGDHTRLEWLRLQSMTGQVPQHLPRQRSPPPSYPSRTILSEQGAAREPSASSSSESVDGKRTSDEEKKSAFISSELDALVKSKWGNR